MTKEEAKKRWKDEVYDNVSEIDPGEECYGQILHTDFSLVADLMPRKHTKL